MEGDPLGWDPKELLRLLISGCSTKAELAELARSLGVRPRSSATKFEIEAEILAIPARNARLAMEVGWDPKELLRLLISDCSTKAELAELARSLGVRPRSSATKFEIEAEILAIPARNARLAMEAERDHRIAAMRELRDQRRVEQELERRKRRSNPVQVKAKKKSNKKKTPTSLAPHETAPDPSSRAPTPVAPGAEFCNACSQRVNADGSCGC
jgi:hypothetical protein